MEHGKDYRPRISARDSLIIGACTVALALFVVVGASALALAAWRFGVFR